MNRCASHRPSKHKSLLDRGVTIIELLVVLGVISILGSIAYVNYTGAAQTSERAKLEADVKTLNAAVPLFLSNGGSFDGSETEEQVLDLLKTAAGNENAAGLSGSLIDLRIQTERQSAAEGATSQARAVWNSTSRRFEILTAGAAGVKRFVLGDPTGGNATARTPGLAYATNSTWLWEFTNAVATNTSGGTNPVTVVGATNQPAVAVTKLSPPTITPPGGARSLTEYQPTLTVTLSNPNAAGAVYYSLSGGGRTAYTAPIQAPVGATVLAWVEANGAANWINSDIATAVFTATPFVITPVWTAPGSVTFREAGGAMAEGGSVTPSPLGLAVDVTGVHASFLGGIAIKYTLDGTDPATSGTAVTISGATGSIAWSYANFTSADGLPLRAVAVPSSEIFSAGGEATQTIGVTQLTLPAPVVLPSSPIIPQSIRIQNVYSPDYPATWSIYYTTNGNNPLNPDGTTAAGASVYSAPFPPPTTETSFTVKAELGTSPSIAFWFLNDIVTKSYQPITGANGLVTPGAIVGSGDIKGAFSGSIIFSNPQSLINFNSKGRILNGNLYLPGLPRIEIPGQGNQAKVIVNSGAAYSEAGLVSRSIVGGAEFLEDGTEVSPAVDTRQIVDLAGGTSPANYTFKFLSDTYIEGKVYRRANAPAVPTITLPTDLVFRGNVTLSSGNRTLEGGHYGSVSVSGTSSVLRLGVAGSATPTVYRFDTLSLTRGRVEILGPVIVTVANGFTVGSSMIMGNSSDPGRLQLQMFAGNLSVEGDLFARVIAPTSKVSVGNGGYMNGSLVAREMEIAPNGEAVFSIPPLIANPTPTPTPTP